jgi:hypothetical protein
MEWVVQGASLGITGGQHSFQGNRAAAYVRHISIFAQIQRRSIFKCEAFGEECRCGWGREIAKALPPACCLMGCDRVDQRPAEAILWSARDG